MKPEIEFLDNVDPKDVNTRLVVTDEPESMPDYECVVCGFESNDKDDAIIHQKEFKHEMWVKRKL